MTVAGSIMQGRDLSASSFPFPLFLPNPSSLNGSIPQPAHFHPGRLILRLDHVACQAAQGSRFTSHQRFCLISSFALRSIQTLPISQLVLEEWSQQKTCNVMVTLKTDPIAGGNRSINFSSLCSHSCASRAPTEQPGGPDTP